MIIRDDFSFCYKRKHKKLKIACIFDPFTFECFNPEADFVELVPNNIEDQLYKIDPDFVFIESAWQGKDNLWSGKLIYLYDVMGRLAHYCAEKFIPIVFWNKEDPFGFDSFLNVAKIADVVFTTASECVEKYKKELKHDNVYFMHFAAQPKLHNPTEEYDRLDKFCFAGAYYPQFPERNKVFEKIYTALDSYKGVDIYDRFYDDKKRRFPKQYQKSVLGTLKYNEISKAYKGYKYNININSITDSESMFARRVFELLASGTVVVGNYSKGLVNYFGDLTISSDNPDEIIERLKEINKTPESFEEYRERFIKRVVEKELYSHRLNQVSSVLFER